MEFKQEPNRLERARNQKILQDSFLSTLSTVFSIYPNLSMLQHLEGIKLKLSKINRNIKIESGKNNDERFVKATEKYLQDLELDPPQLWNQGEDELTEIDINNFHERNSHRA